MTNTAAPAKYWYCTFCKQLETTSVAVDTIMHRHGSSLFLCKEIDIARFTERSKGLTNVHDQA